MAGIDLLTGTVHALVKDRHRSREFIEFLKILDTAYPAATAIKVILDNHSAHISRETKTWLAAQPDGRFAFVFTPKHGYWLNLIEGFFSKAARSVLRHIRVKSTHELKQRIIEFINDRLRRRVGVLRPSSAQSRLRGPLAEEVGQRVDTERRASQLEAERDHFWREHDSLLNSTFWRLTGPFRRVVSVRPPGLRNGEKLDAVISRPGRFDRWPVAAAAELGRDAAFVVRRAPDAANQQKSARLC
jgi:transposase